MDAKTVRGAQFIDLHLEAEIDPDVGGVVVPLMSRDRESERTRRNWILCVSRSHCSRKTKFGGIGVVHQKRPRSLPPTVSSVPSITRMAAGIVAPGLITDGRHPPLRGVEAVEEDLKAVAGHERLSSSPADRPGDAPRQRRSASDLASQPSGHKAGPAT